MAESRRSAMLMGIALDRLSMTAWGSAGGLATMAGVFLAAFPSPGVDASLAGTALCAFPAAILGGIDSPGAPCPPRHHRDPRPRLRQ